MIKVAYVVSTLKRCGPTQQLFYIIRHLDRAQFEPLVITLSPEPADSLQTRFEEAGIPLQSLGLSRWAGLFFARSKLLQMLQSAGVDLLHTQGLRADSLAASLRRIFPAVASLRNFPQKDYPMTYGSLRGRWMARTHVRALRRLAAPTGVSAAVSRNLHETFGVEAQTVCNGVEISSWTPSSTAERLALRRQLDLPEDGSVWVSVGHLSVRKDPLTVVRGFQSLRDERHCLVFLGSGELDADCRAAAAGAPYIRFAGRVENVADFLRAADGFVSASHAEGFPNAVLEALACGLPCVLSDIPPHREIAEQVELGVLLFPEGDERALARQIETVEPTEALRAALRTDAEQTFSAAAMSARYQAIYKQLCARRKHA